MLAWTFEAGLRDLEERQLDFLTLLQRVARRAPEKAVDVRDAMAALAAAECVASGSGRPPALPPEVLLRWLEAHPEPPALPVKTAAIKALDRLRGEPGLPPEVAFDDLWTRLHGGEGRRPAAIPA